MSDITLYQFNRSHYNERARWALDYKGLPHKRVSLLPGPHAGTVKKLTKGATTSVPLLVVDGEVTSGSTNILDRIEALAPSPALLPADPVLQQKVRDVEAEFEGAFGVEIRVAMFAVMTQKISYVGDVFASQTGALKRGIYKTLLPAVRPIMAKEYGFDDPVKVKHANDVTLKGLDRIAQLTSATGYAVGDEFTRADLTLAALASITSAPLHPDMTLPEPMPHPVQDFLQHYHNHPACVWVRSIYEKHRPAPLAPPA